MKILVLNCGSSSIKYKLYNMDDNSVLAAGGVERIGLDESFIKVTLPNGEKKKIMHDMPDHKEGVNFVFQCLLDPEIGAIKSLDEIDAVGHRIVQGGDLFEKSVIVDKSVEDGIESLCDLAPVHNAGHLKGLRAVDKLMPNTPQVCVFDNAFHSTMPDYAYLYAVPYELYEKYHVRRYGFHGTSHRYVSQRVCEFLGRDINTQRIITCHIGNGASASAQISGKPIDTSMGLTPLEGLMMGGRTGDIDPAAVFHLIRNAHMSVDELDTLFNKRSGLTGMCGHADMREVHKLVAAGDKDAKLALDVYVHRIIKYVGDFTAQMGGVDVITFTAGVGENDEIVRKMVCDRLAPFGIKLDEEKNNTRSKQPRIISTPDSSVVIAVIPTNEELAIARKSASIAAEGKDSYGNEFTR